MNMLARNRCRDLWRMRGQALPVVFVAAVSVANLVMSRAPLESLEASRERYYRDYGFADAFATLRRAADAHGVHENRAGGHDANWADWYAAYIVREQAGEPLPS